MNTQNLIQIIAIAIVLGVSGLSWLYRKLREQAALKRIEDERRRRQEELLRTGRDPLAEPAPPDDGGEERRRQHEIAARREAELQELRRRQAGAPIAQRPAPAQVQVPPGILIQIPGTSSPIVVKPLPGGGRVTTARTPAPPQRQPRPARPRGPRPTKRPAERKPEPVQRDTPRPSPALEQLPPPTSPDAAAPSPHPTTPEEWRRAIIMREILSPPLAARPPGNRDLF